MHRPGLLIQKKRIFDAKGWSRYYTQTKIDSYNMTFVTEKQLCRYIYDNFGEGSFMITAWRKGRRGLWIFWKGEINSYGFIFERKVRSNTREINRLKKEQSETTNPEERAILQEDIDLEREINKYVSYGFYPFLRPSGIRGTFVSWDDPDISPKQKAEQFEKW